MNYIIITAFTTEKLVSLVNEMIEKGYKPQGGPLNKLDQLGYYHQAMVSEKGS